MMPLAIGLFNVISGLVVDRATDLAKEHVDKMINDVLPKDTKKALDKIIKEDPAHAFKDAKSALQGAVEGKLPVIKADGTVLPIEFTVKVSYDPGTGKIDIKKSWFFLLVIL